MANKKTKEARWDEEALLGPLSHSEADLLATRSRSGDRESLAGAPSMEEILASLEGLLDSEAEQQLGTLPVPVTAPTTAPAAPTPIHTLKGFEDDASLEKELMASMNEAAYGDSNFAEEEEEVIDLAGFEFSASEKAAQADTSPATPVVSAAETQAEEEPMAATTEPPTEAPEVTAPVTEAPEETESPTEAPEVTEPPTEAPEVTEPVTEAPEVTEPPTEAPEVTEPPTEAPEVTAPVTEAPEVTESPTEAPEETEPPTEAPEVTEPATEAPEVTEPVTEAPEETAPPTEAPEVTEAPTEAPEVTEPPTAPAEESALTHSTVPTETTESLTAPTPPAPEATACAVVQTEAPQEVALTPVAHETVEVAVTARHADVVRIPLPSAFASVTLTPPAPLLSCVALTPAAAAENSATDQAPQWTVPLLRSCFGDRVERVVQEMARQMLRQMLPDMLEAAIREELQRIKQESGGEAVPSSAVVEKSEG
ncbi:MAG: hypothetical protein HQM04_15930 [Magnetococcales bacterium]|nr:hypothetical protein [Magnetococcales bacterium]